MVPLPAQCPFSGGEIIVTRFYCPEHDITVEGRFAVHAPFPQLSPEQLQFVETFVRSEGKLSRMEDELGISYPTVRNRLHEVIRAMGFEPGKDTAEPAAAEEGVRTASSADERRKILEDLDSGRVDFQTAMKQLKGEQE